MWVVLTSKSFHPIFFSSFRERSQTHLPFQNRDFWVLDSNQNLLVFNPEFLFQSPIASTFPFAQSAVKQKNRSTGISSDSFPLKSLENGQAIEDSLSLVLLLASLCIPLTRFQSWHVGAGVSKALRCGMPQEGPVPNHLLGITNTSNTNPNDNSRHWIRQVTLALPIYMNPLN